MISVPIPPLVPRSLHTGNTIPTGIIHHPLPLLRRPGNRYHHLFSFNRWQLAHRGPSITVLGAVGAESDFIIRFTSSETEITPQRCVLQPSSIFRFIPESTFTMMQSDGTGDAISCRMNDWLRLELRIFSQHADGSFSLSDTQGFAFDDELDWDFRRLCSGPMCPVTGSVLIAKVDKEGFLVHGTNIALARYTPYHEHQSCELTLLIVSCERSTDGRILALLYRMLTPCMDVVAHHYLRNAVLQTIFTPPTTHLYPSLWHVRVSVPRSSSSP